MHLYGLTFILFITTQLIFSCSMENKQKEIYLTGESWKLEKLTTGKFPEITIEKPASYTLNLEENGNFRMHSDCNKCSGKYSTASKFIKFTDFECTKNFCGGASHDYLFRKHLEKASSFKIIGSELILKNYEGRMNFSIK